MLAIPVDISFLFAVFSECRFSVPATESHRSVASLTPCRRVHRKVISHSDGYSVVRSALCPPHNQLGNRFQFERNKFCKLSANDKKSRYTAHQTSVRKSLAISLMKLCTGSEIQKPSMSAFSAPQADDTIGAVVGCLVFHSDIQLWLSNESI